MGDSKLAESARTAKLHAELEAGDSLEPVSGINPVFQMTFLGVMDKGDKRRPELLYALTSRCPNASIYNLIQNAALILNNSRVIYFDLIFKLLTYFDPKLTELG